MDFKKIENKWRKIWEEQKVFQTNVWDFSKPKYYVLDMFPYPSAEGLHVGHPEGYTATDIVARMKRMQGFNVLHPMGFDSFGLPAEQYAIKTGDSPVNFTKRSIENFTKQLKMLGFSFDWSKQISTHDPEFFKWTQWIFKQLFLSGLAKYETTTVNWCEELGTVLANDEIVDGKSERGGFDVVKKEMKQWVIDIPTYVERLLEGLDGLDWPEGTKEMQRNWFGKSEGARVDFYVQNQNEKFTVFTTRPDTLFGATYCVLAPEHELVQTITTAEQLQVVNEYREATLKKSDLDRTGTNKVKTGVFTGAFAINPVNSKPLPIYISDYVLKNYGTGAIMAVPAHDARDYEFAKTFGLEIIPVLEGGNVSESAHEGDGLHINSDFLNGLNKEDAISKIILWLQDRGAGERAINYKIREWIFARQRYWGEPVPIIHLDNGKMVVLGDDELPLTLPTLNNYAPDKSGLSPLDRADNWVNVVVDSERGRRETSTMPGSAGSSWYFMRYIDPNNNNEFANYELLKHWLPVDLYMGGTEHAVGHLIYSRFFTNFLFDKGLSPVKEPFARLAHQGMILGENGEKMSKSKGNVVNPDDIVEKYGADALRIYEMFMGPLKEPKPWISENVVGAKKFIDRVWRLYVSENKITNEPNENLEKIYHETVKKVSVDYEALNVNTAISQLMIFINAVYKENNFPREYAEGFIKLFNPVAPFVTEEIWQTVLGHEKTIAYEAWPNFDEKKLINETFECVIQVNGKFKGKIVANVGIKETELQKLLHDSEFGRVIGQLNVKKVIYVPNRIINFIGD